MAARRTEKEATASPHVYLFQDQCRESVLRIDQTSGNHDTTALIKRAAVADSRELVMLPSINHTEQPATYAA